MTADGADGSEEGVAGRGHQPRRGGGRRRRPAPRRRPTPTPTPAPAPATAAKPAPGDLKPDDEGFIRSWLVLAPIPFLPAKAAPPPIDKEQLPDEKDLKPKEGDKVKVGDKELTWKAAKADSYLLDFNQVFGAKTDNSAAYAVCYVQSDGERKDLQLLIGSDDQGEGLPQRQGSREGHCADRPADKDQDKADNVTLNAGTNVVVFKVVNGSGGWQGCLRFKDKTGQPVKDLKIKLAP